MCAAFQNSSRKCSHFTNNVTFMTDFKFNIQALEQLIHVFRNSIYMYAVLHSEVTFLSFSNSNDPLRAKSILNACKT